MTARFRYESITFSDGTTVPLASEGVVVLVGPNNTGKTIALQDMVNSVQSLTPGTRVVTGVETRRLGSERDLETWLEEQAFGLDQATGRHYRRGGAFVSWEVLRSQWTSATQNIPTLFPFFVFYASATERLGVPTSSGPYDPINATPSDPVQVLFARPDLEKRISDIAFEAFGSRLVVSRVWGSSISLYIGTTNAPPTDDVKTLLPSEKYVAELRDLEPVGAQGDGFRSFLGLMLSLVSAQYQVIVVDEPEGFLHPPQAQLLGRKLASEAPDRTQVFVATHSKDVLQGVLEARGTSVTVIRLTRRGNINYPAVLSADDLKELWRDPLLRYSNALEALFHRGAVVCEADSDARFYSAVLNALHDQENLPPHDLLFTQSGGKQRLSVLVRALRAVGVPVAVIADFDLLREREVLEELIRSLGGTWSDLDGAWRTVSAAIGQLTTAASIIAVRERVNAVFDTAAGPTLTAAETQRIREVIRVDDGWARAKRGGLSSLPQGEASRRAQTLDQDLRALGIFVVPVGELERWMPEIGGHGPAWVSAALERHAHEDPTLGARRFIRDVARWLDQQAPNQGA